MLVTLALPIGCLPCWNLRLGLVDRLDGLDAFEMPLDVEFLGVYLEERQTMIRVCLSSDGGRGRLFACNLTEDFGIQDLYVEADCVLASPNRGRILVFQNALLDQASRCNTELSLLGGCSAPTQV